MFEVGLKAHFVMFIILIKSQLARIIMLLEMQLSVLELLKLEPLPKFIKQRVAFTFARNFKGWLDRQFHLFVPN